MKKKKILFVTSELIYGGAEKMIVFLANSLCQREYNVTVYSYEGKTSYYELDERIKFIPEENIQSNYYVRRFIQVFQVRKKIRAINTDVVISFLTNQNVFSILGTAFTKIPVIISERGDPAQNNGIIAKLKYFFYRFANGSVFQTEGARDFFCDQIKRKSVIIPNPVTFIQKARVSDIERKNEIAFVARFEIKQKRQDIMIQAFRKVLYHYKGIKLVFYGDGPDMLKIEKMAEQYGIKDNVIFAGLVNNIQNHIVDAKMFVLTSDYEGIPNALIEAMTVGLPVIATDCSPGGARLLIDNYKNGILVPTGDIDKIADSIRFYLDNPSIAEAFGSKAQKVTETFSPDKIIGMWDELINKIVNSNK